MSYGAAARCVQKGDKVIIMTYMTISPEELAVNSPKIVFVDENNKILSVRRHEKHGCIEHINI